MYKAILLSLNKTLSPDWRRINPHMPGAEDRIRNEKYNLWLANWLRKVDSEVYLFAVRDAKWQELTLDAITKATSWKPDRAYFNDTDHKSGNIGGIVKEIYLNRLLDETGLKTGELYAFESNTDAFRMWKRRGVPGKIVAKCSDLPSDEWFTEASG